MESTAAKAARYEASHPNTELPEAQKAERQERLELKSRSYGSRTRIFTMPAMPWHEEKQNAQD